LEANFRRPSAVPVYLPVVKGPEGVLAPFPFGGWIPCGEICYAKTARAFASKKSAGSLRRNSFAIRSGQITVTVPEQKPIIAQVSKLSVQKANHYG